ncbi:MarR family winged helix-turn-helix transcriptional regulator [Microbulbifer discodermiae]|uniref:MarR family winged helix-turn-helix transcriptional regulator n=1 Tax=Microbulbifer sp. 2201CG32-9 TaxID=3232309 RepID=UPI00345B886F
MEDSVDVILQQWRNARPDLDCSAMGVVGRLRRVNGIWQKQLEEIFAQFELSGVEFDILATLGRSQVALTPTELYQTLMLSSGAMSTRIEQLVQRGLIERSASETDRRSCRVQLSGLGQKRLDAALEAHLENMDNMLAMLNKREQGQLANLLKKILVSNSRSE